MTAALDMSRRAHHIARGFEIAARHDWLTAARAHLAIYDRLKERADA
jgi:hypothetical protein